MGCGVERDLDPGRFACSQGGPCDAGIGGGDAGTAVDAGGVDLSRCQGTYGGTSFRLDSPRLSGSVSGVLLASGELSLDFITAAHPGGLTVLARVGADGAVRIDGAATVGLMGVFNRVSCTGAGTWTEGGQTADWDLEKDE